MRAVGSILFLLITLTGWAASPNELIRKRVESLMSGMEVVVQGEKLYGVKLLPEFYQRRMFDMAWAPDDRNALLQVLSDAEKEGLRSVDYHFEQLMEMSATVRTTQELAELDLLLTDAYLLYASHFLNGKVNPETVDSEWKAVRREGNARVFLETAIEENDIAGSLHRLAPTHQVYAQLKRTLKLYMIAAKKGGWPVVRLGETLKRDMRDSTRVPGLIRWLVASGDLKEQPADLDLYSEAVEQAVRRFQIRHGLEVDGNLGKATVSAMNVPVQQRIDQIRINMERYRWINQDLGAHYVTVNIADFQMKVYRDDQLAFEQKVIVGKPFRKTPVFSGKMSYMVLNPYWTVPPTILFNDMLPELRKDAGYVKIKNIRIFRTEAGQLAEVDPYTVDWSALSRNYFPYTLRQDPGPTNALGQVKFMFPNKYNVYLHDTPSRELFNRTERAFSSGCIRVNKPMDFVQYLIAEDPQWNVARINKIIDSGKEQTIPLTKPLNVHILYLTTWMDNGMVHFRKDLYERDAAVLAALNEPAPAL